MKKLTLIIVAMMAYAAIAQTNAFVITNNDSKGTYVSMSEPVTIQFSGRIFNYKRLVRANVIKSKVGNDVSCEINFQIRKLKKYQSVNGGFKALIKLKNDSIIELISSDFFNPKKYYHTDFRDEYFNMFVSYSLTLQQLEMLSKSELKLVRIQTVTGYVDIKCNEEEYVPLFMRLCGEIYKSNFTPSTPKVTDLRKDLK